MVERFLRFFKRRFLPLGKEYRTIAMGAASGCVLRLDLQRHLKLYVGLYEIELTPYIRRFATPGRRCFDVGASIGYDAVMLAKLTQSDVVAFECDPEAIQELRETFKRNPRLQISLVEGAVGRQSGPSTVTIDQASARFFQPDFIKMDIEGSEVEALEGALATLHAARPDLLIEVHSLDNWTQCSQMLLGLGYRLKAVTPRRWLRDKRPAPFNQWLVASARELN